MSSTPLSCLDDRSLLGRELRVGSQTAMNGAVSVNPWNIENLSAQLGARGKPNVAR